MFHTKNRQPRNKKSIQKNIKKDFCFCAIFFLISYKNFSQNKPEKIGTTILQVVDKRGQQRSTDWRTQRETTMFTASRARQKVVEARHDAEYDGR